MTTATETPLMTTAELLALPDDDGIERELVRGRLKDREMTRRNRRHARSGAKLAKMLGVWLEQQPEPRGEILVGDAAIRLRQNPDSTVAVDLAYISPQMARANPDDAFVLDGVPILMVEILSPSDKQEDILDKVRDYLDAGVPLVWIAEPVFRTVTVYQPNAEPVLYTVKQTIT
ncbi:MAG TPA: Uma2 family endonuclease, partial [Tepidisphaeraceae bacterium]|nr:Uma2 family endonuclease [Tepidisphaeraceae bacterium]